MITQGAPLDVLDGLEVLICGLDGDGKIRFFNRPCEQLTGIPREQALGRSWLEIFADAGRSEHVASLWRQARREAPAGPYQALFHNGRSIRWQFSRWDSGQLPPVILWAVGIDVTHEREALVRARELDRIVALGNLISGLTHELRNPLNGALLQLALADRSLDRSDRATAPTLEAIAQAASEIRRISSLLDDFLAFVRPQPLTLERTDARAVAARAIERSRLKAEAAEVSVVLEPGGEATAEIDGARVERAVFQLLNNAIDAAAGTTDRVVRVRIAIERNSVAIEVDDRGAGLPSPDSPIFEPFFTTKKGGTGLGLAIVQRVCAEHGGLITHERRDAATVFRLELPIMGGVAGP